MRLIFEYEENSSKHISCDIEINDRDLYRNNNGNSNSENEKEEGEKDAQIEIPKDLLRSELPLPNVSELTVVRHYTNMSRANFGIDLGFYPLGSCTMKYNPKVNEDIA
jgi:glycine cleavage system protein P-like pyridoxal-binding family